MLWNVAKSINCNIFAVNLDKIKIRNDTSIRYSK